MKINVIEYLMDSAKKYPDKIALIDEQKKITFAQLNCEAKKVSTAILKSCGQIKNHPIAVYMEKSVDCIIAFLGILYSGNFYSPLDLKMPPERIEKIMDTLQPKAVICNSKISGSFGNAIKKIYMSDLPNTETENEYITNYQKILDVDPVYVLFTSGSTGMPKGVVISHKGVIDYTEWLYDKFHFNHNTVFGNQAPFYFDNSILDIYSTLKNGATMNIIPEKLFLFPKKLLEYMNQSKVNTLFWVPSALIGVANSGALDCVPLKDIKNIIFCGEVMPNKQLNMWRKRYPDVLYANLYGPTEITDVCTYYIVDRKFADEEPLPIGKECENTEILVFNENNRLVKRGEIGELCVRGTCLSMGYYRETKKTREAFIQNPLNDKYTDYIYKTGDLVKINEYGEIIYIGRKDYQIKHQGYRIELGEIETISNALEGIDRSCAVYDDVNKKIVLFCGLKIGFCTNVTEKTVYMKLKQYLPFYMLPAEICLVDELPVNANGKIDRMRLKMNLLKKESDQNERKNISNYKRN